MTSPSISRCVCGAETASVQFSNYGYVVECGDCGWRSSIEDTEAEAVAAWNLVMRPRPMVVVKDIGWGMAECRPFGAIGFPPRDIGAIRAELTNAGFEIATPEGEVDHG